MSSEKGTSYFICCAWPPWKRVKTCSQRYNALGYKKRDAMESRSRPYQTEDDFWSMRQFLRHIFLLNNRLMRSWHVTRLDYAR